jgi:hypothetical protein
MNRLFRSLMGSLVFGAALTGPAAAQRTDTAPRFEPKKDLPSLDELFARRPDPRRTKSSVRWVPCA